MEPITKACQDAGIPLCYVNRNPYSGVEDTMPANVYYVGSQEIKAGEMQMEYAGELLAGKGGICILEGQLTNEGAVKRTQGVTETAAATFPDIEVLGMDTGNWQRDQGMSLTETWITKFGDKLNCILANNDEMALGAVAALAAAGRTDVIVMGVDAIPDALQAVKDGTLAGTVLQDAVGQGEGSIKVIQSVLTGGKSDSVVWIDFQLVTPENIDDFM
jgi:inositol transport system substrate-binding protein